MKKHFIVIEIGSGDYFIVNSLETLITEMYGDYSEGSIDSFYNIHRIIEIEGIIVNEIN